MTLSTTVPHKAGTGWFLAPLFLGTFMSLLDVSIVNIALPTIQSDLTTSLAQLQWIVDGYIVALAAFMLTGGSLADRFGRKAVFLIGVAGFTVASLACALADSADWLIAARVVQGAAASVLTPGAMSLIAQAFPEPARRARIIGLWSSVASSAFVLGPLIGGPLTEAFGWRSVFYLNVPLGMLTVVVGLRRLRESADPEHASPDVVGQLLAIGWIGALTYGIIDGGHRGWTEPPVLAALGLAAVLFVAFILIELRQQRPMLPIRLFARPEFGLVNLAAFVMGFGTFGSFFLLSIYLQSVRGATPTEAALQFLPYVLANTTAGLLAGRLVSRFGGRLPLVAGYTLITVALLGMLVLTPTTPYPVIAVLFVIIGFGLSTGGVPTNTMALHAVPRHSSGMAASTVNATRQTGTAVGVAVLGAVVAAQPTFTDGLRHALLVAGVATGVVTVLLATRLRAK
ncbi:EmrB/QacA subfamily drug resistance transporter [Herbihabitans rhizosphaerae]|uniref:EmrB/QacA subfamily drug resistance transporter n=1 Tax=Herbihabitans rhizosphaerae TaxID=1872711 RepID=A0A4Q7KDY1_9PSEU|nr:DHA2 family efflux MFS transporter permease subunit [Herbihabitans rhizosphaerae]RZS32435.1 EmrB/QacA subfamily drug resistance transporter [Herbihabitans rhizosphaerae]